MASRRISGRGGGTAAHTVGRSKTSFAMDFGFYIASCGGIASKYYMAVCLVGGMYGCQNQKISKMPLSDPAIQAHQ